MKKHKVEQTRRAFLKSALVTGGAAAVVVAARDALTAPESPSKATTAQPESRSKGYHVTQHIQDYYKTARS